MGYERGNNWVNNVCQQWMTILSPSRECIIRGIFISSKTSWWLMLIPFATPNFLSLLTTFKLRSMELNTTYHHGDSYEGKRESVDRFNSWRMAQFLYFAALLVLCRTGDSLETTTSPQQQHTGDNKEWCEVRCWISVVPSNDKQSVDLQFIYQLN